MFIFVLAAAALILAAVLWYNQASGTTKEVPQPPLEADTEQLLRQTLARQPSMVEALAEAIRALEAVMAHPELGGPGFLLVQFPPAPDCGNAVVMAQYPNIREGLYRRIVRQELYKENLAAAGIPEALLAQKPFFETESGGVVLISVQVNEVLPEFAKCLHTRRERSIALGILAEALGARLPLYSTRIFGADLLLSPDREHMEASRH